MNTEDIINDYSANLSDGKLYLFYPGPFKDIRSLARTIRIFTVKTVKDCQDEDWKTAIAQNKPIIPAGTELQVKQVMRNFYGTFIEVEYFGYLYYVNPYNLIYVGSKEIKA